MSRHPIAVVGGVAAAALVVAVATVASPAQANPTAAANRHVLLVSVDGLHQTDLSRYVSTHPHSAMAGMVAGGVEYTSARTSFPSDSFPGMLAQLTGATPGASGVYYDDSYNRTFFAPGTLDCSTATPGAEIPWTEGIDRSQNPITLDAGQGLTDAALTDLPTNTKAQTIASTAAITAAALKMTATPQTLLSPAALPVDPHSCLPVYPSQYLTTNTVFEVARSHGLRTAWSDKHPAYEILNGPSGSGVQDLFTPEINSIADNAGDDWTTDNALTQVYDSVKVQAILNQIDGYDHSRTHKVGTPAVFGMNFQTLSTAEKLPLSDGLAGGYLAGGAPGPLVARALDYVDAQLGRMLEQIARDGMAGQFTVIVSAKHGQSPIDQSTLRRVDDSAIITALDAAWTAQHPGAAPLVAFSLDDDGMLFWLSDRSAQALAFAKSFLLTHTAPANTVTDPKGTYSTTVASSGLTSVAVGAAADALFRATPGDSHAPDLVGIAQIGVVYTGGVKKIAEHGGAAPADRDVALVVAGTSVPHGKVIGTPVQTTQIAPSILRLLGINPRELQAVRTQGTATLPGL
ncbi:alkaline phosphatase family protein [Microbacterium deminutum]|uniref:Alkaline phosphatase family protein n=1 Tax=Microbacterium deminutum TaxID=344164 RepID=A0ABN2RH70_9MICO